MSENQFDLSNYIGRGFYSYYVYTLDLVGIFAKYITVKGKVLGAIPPSIHLLIFLVHILAKLFCISGPDSSKMVLKVSMPSRIQTHKLVLSV